MGRRHLDRTAARRYPPSGEGWSASRLRWQRARASAGRTAARASPRHRRRSAPCAARDSSPARPRGEFAGEPVEVAEAAQHRFVGAGFPDNAACARPRSIPGRIPVASPPSNDLANQSCRAAQHGVRTEGALVVVRHRWAPRSITSRLARRPQPRPVAELPSVTSVPGPAWRWRRERLAGELERGPRA